MHVRKNKRSSDLICIKDIKRNSGRLNEGESVVAKGGEVD